jgi:hypothetical protein
VGSSAPRRIFVQPYVIRQGDYLAKLAHQFDFDADTVWNSGKNATLRKLRPNPNVLYPTDILYIPNQAAKEPVTTSLKTGSNNSFVSDPPTVTVTVRFLDAPLASQAYSVPELPKLTGLTTGGDGTATVAIPVTLATFTIVFTESDLRFEFRAGGLDPIDTLTGVLHRLQSLGYVAADASADPPDLDVLRRALRVLKAASDGGGSSTDVPDAADTGLDDAGLTDKGELDDALSKMLIAAHGI